MQPISSALSSNPTKPFYSLSVSFVSWEGKSWWPSAGALFLISIFAFWVRRSTQRLQRLPPKDIHQYGSWAVLCITSPSMIPASNALARSLACQGKNILLVVLLSNGNDDGGKNSDEGNHSSWEKLVEELQLHYKAEARLLMSDDQHTKNSILAQFEVIGGQITISGGIGLYLCASDDDSFKENSDGTASSLLTLGLRHLVFRNSGVVIFISQNDYGRLNATNTRHSLPQCVADRKHRARYQQFGIQFVTISAEQAINSAARCIGRQGDKRVVTDAWWSNLDRFIVASSSGAWSRIIDCFRRRKDWFVGSICGQQPESKKSD